MALKTFTNWPKLQMPYHWKLKCPDLSQMYGVNYVCALVSDNHNPNLDD